jgi:hypothetical protein
LSIILDGILEFFGFVYITELVGIDTGEKCLGDHKNPWAVGCAYGVTIGKSGAGWEKAIKTGDWKQDPCVIHCGIWQRVRRLIGRFKVRSKFDFHIPTCILGVRGTTFTTEITDDGATLIVVLEGEVEVMDKTYLQSITIHEGQMITVTPQKPLTEPCLAGKELLGELKNWKENIINKEDIEELKMPESAVIELPKGRLNYVSSGSEKGG